MRATKNSLLTNNLYKKRGYLAAQVKEHATLDLGAMSLSPMLGVEST